MKARSTNNLTEHLEEVANGIRSAKDDAEVAEIVRWSAAEIQERINAERLDAASRLAAWLAHQTNNPLGTISGNAQLLAKRLERDTSDPALIETYSKYIDGIRIQIERCVHITSDLLDFTRSRDVELKSVNVLEAIEEAAELAKYGRNQCKLSIVTPECQLPAARTDREFIIRVLYEVMANALIAASDSGNVTVEAFHVSDDHNQPVWVEVEITDSGSGIAADVMPRIFEPFFSTREKARGLGLTRCLTIMKQLGGTIGVTETGPEGTTVTVRIPAGGYR